jgi:hypothetical protein
MKNQLTTIAALPMGGGCMSALPAENNEPKKSNFAQLSEASTERWKDQAIEKEEQFLRCLEWLKKSPLEFHEAPYEYCIYQPSIRLNTTAATPASGPDELLFPPIEAPPTIEELAKKYLAAHEGLVE